MLVASFDENDRDCVYPVVVAEQRSEDDNPTIDVDVTYRYVSLKVKYDGESPIVPIGTLVALERFENGEWHTKAIHGPHELKWRNDQPVMLCHGESTVLNIAILADKPSAIDLRVKTMNSPLLEAIKTSGDYRLTIRIIAGEAITKRRLRIKWEGIWQDGCVWLEAENAN